MVEKMPLTSEDIHSERIARLREDFPEVFTEGKVDFEKLKQALGDEVITDRERYGLSWAGKSEAVRNIQTPSVATLVPDREESVEFDATENLFIEGDNLEVLKLLQKGYHGKVKMIYIDPPYNTGNEFIYPDNFREGIDDYLRYSGQVDGNGIKLSTNTETGGRYHSKWLNMMYPRLFLARNLLREDGVFVSHIDEHEEAAIKLLLDELFGEENFLGTIIWNKRNPKGDATGVAYQHESVLLYARNRNVFVERHSLQRPKANAQLMLQKARSLMLELKGNQERINAEFAAWVREQKNLSGGEAAYNKIDEDGDVYRPVSMAWPNKKKAPDEYFIPLTHPTTGRPCPVPERGWRNPPQTMRVLLEKNLILFGPDESTQPTRKYLLKENLMENVPSILSYAGSDDAFFSSLGISFDNPKPYRFSLELVSYFATDSGDVVLDFFAGSGTSAHAVLELNKQDNGNRKFIMVQLPEPTGNPDYPTIADIGKERIRRVIEKLNEEDNGKLRAEDESPQDRGFKVFKPTSSNFKIWDGAEASEKPEQLAAQLRAFAENVLPDRSREDILYEILLKSGLPLTAEVGRLEVAGREVHAVAGGLLFVCLEDHVDEELVREVAELKPERFVCLDFAFDGNDKLKTNTVLQMKDHGIEFRTV
jgi:adenine-specific DNA-methyltransferase